MIRTPRLTLRRWRPETDLPGFAALHGDRDVMRWLGQPPMTAAQSGALLALYDTHFEQHGHGLWAVEHRRDGVFLGLCGLRRFDSPGHPMSPCVEIVWRQARAAWGQGFATEAANATLADGFVRLGIKEITGFTADANHRSQRLMARIGMRRLPAQDFAHPALPEAHELRDHVVFAINSTGWMQHLATSSRYA